MRRAASNPTTATVCLVAVVVVVVGLGGAGHLDSFATQVVDDAAQFLGAVAAVGCCLWTARRHTGGQRAWRLWLAVGMTGWGIGQLIWSYNQLFVDRPLPSPSWADAGYLSLFVPALLALISLAGRWQDDIFFTPRPSRFVVVLDGLVLVGALFVLTWTSALGAVVHAGAPTAFAFGVAIAYPITDLILVVIVVLLLTVSPMSRAANRQLVLLGGGLFAISFSDSLFAYLVASGAQRMPPLADIGFIVGPPLLALAALTPLTTDRWTDGGQRPILRWGHLLLPYVPVAATCGLIVVQVLRGDPVERLEIAVETAVVALLIIRQGITLVENARLLDRVSEGRQRLTHQAFHDTLTGLANRALFRDRLDHAFALHRRDGGRLAVLFLDLDDFKAVNDRYGHAVGDRLLCAVSDRLCAGVRGGDTVARLGGDEFAVLLEGAGDADATARQLLDALRRPYEIDGRTLVVGASVGLVEAGDDPTVPGRPSDTDAAEALVRRADAAMYAGKRRGKNTLVRYHLDLADETGTSDLSQLLAAALADGRGLDVHYQPIVRIADGTVVAVEALARWTDPLIGPVPPDVFIAAAERVGLVGQIDDFVLDRACRDAAGLRGSWSDVVMHVNVSAGRFGRPEQERAVLDALHRHRLAPHRLLLELTETVRLEDLTAAAEAAGRLTRHGVQLALDDFGTGYNALAQLHALPVDVVKLDRSFVAAGSGRGAAMCRSVVAICTEMGVRVIAEGIENTREASRMAGLGCSFGQGHRYGRPGPLTDLAPGDAPPPSASASAPAPAAAPAPVDVPIAPSSPSGVGGIPAPAVPGPAGSRPAVAAPGGAAVVRRR